MGSGGRRDSRRIGPRLPGRVVSGGSTRGVRRVGGTRVLQVGQAQEHRASWRARIDRRRCVRSARRVAAQLHRLCTLRAGPDSRCDLGCPGGRDFQSWAGTEPPRGRGHYDLRCGVRRTFPRIHAAASRAPCRAWLGGQPARLRIGAVGVGFATRSDLGGGRGGFFCRNGVGEEEAGSHHQSQ